MLQKQSRNIAFISRPGRPPNLKKGIGFGSSGAIYLPLNHPTSWNSNSLVPCKLKFISMNTYWLTVTLDMKHVHNVFHLLLLLPFLDPQEVSFHMSSFSPLGPARPMGAFWDAKDVDLFLGYWEASPGSHKYLVCWRGGSSTNESWRKVGNLNCSFHPHLKAFHSSFGTHPVTLPPGNAYQGTF